MDRSATGQATRGRAAVSDVLKHYGVPGMKWGVRRSDSEIAAAAVASQVKPGGKVTVTGGKGQPASAEALSAAAARATAKKSGVAALSNNDIQSAVKRMELEQKYVNLANSSSKQSVLGKGDKIVKNMLGYGKTANDVIKFAESPAGRELATQLGVQGSGGARRKK